MEILKVLAQADGNHQGRNSWKCLLKMGAYGNTQGMELMDILKVGAHGNSQRRSSWKSSR
jgi:hypothetical protein